MMNMHWILNSFFIPRVSYFPESIKTCPCAMHHHQHLRAKDVKRVGLTSERDDKGEKSEINKKNDEKRLKMMTASEKD
jgi:hypothetical protein